MTDILKPDPSDHPGAQPRFGRLPAVDTRDLGHRMMAPQSDRTYRNWLSPGPAWDQGQTPHCVAYASNRWLVSHRVVNKIAMPHADLYKECQKNDEWDGEDYDGTSVRGAFKVLKQRGFVESYSWAATIEDVVRHVLAVGPVVAGTDWTADMERTDAKGYIWPTGSVVGGHAWLIVGANRNRKNPDLTVGAVRMVNSWGATWGEHGHAWITLGSLSSLLTGLEGWPGEFCTATELDIS